MTLLSTTLDCRVLKLFRQNISPCECMVKLTDKKIQQILKNPYHFKNLRGDMHGAYRAHIGKSFVLIYESDEKNSIVRFLDYEDLDKTI